MGGNHAIAVAWGLCAILMSGFEATAAPVRALVKEGDLATDGSRLTEIDGLSSVRGGVVFDARTEAIVRIPSDGAPQVLARAGDPLPAPLAGHLETLAAPAIADDGTVVFSATIDSPAASDGIFAIDKDGVKVLGLGLGMADALAVNASLDIVLRFGASRLAIWQKGAPRPVTIAQRRRRLPDGTPWDRIGSQPGISDDGTVAFQATIRSGPFSLRAFRWRADVGLQELAAITLRRRATGIVSPVRLAINRRGDVAEILGSDSIAGVFVHPADRSPAYSVARAGDLVDGVPLDGPQPGFVAIDDQRRVAFLGRFGDANRIVVADGSTLRALTDDLGAVPIVGATRLAGFNTVAWTSNGTLLRSHGQPAPLLGPGMSQLLGPGFVAAGTPSLDDAGDVVVEMDRKAVYLVSRRGAEPLVRAGDAVEGAPPVAVLRTQQGNSGGELSLVATLQDGRSALLVRTEETLRRVAADGDPSPLGGTIGVIDPSAHDVGRRRIAMLLDAFMPGSTRRVLFETASGGPLRAVVSEGERLASGLEFTSLDTPVALRDGIVFSATVSDPTGTAPRSGLFFARRDTIVPIVMVGDRAPGSSGRRIDSMGGVMGTGRGVIFEVGLTGLAGPEAFLAWRPGRRLSRLDRPDPARKTSSIGPFTAVPPFVIGFEEDIGPRLVALSRHAHAVLVRDGDPSPLGGTLTIHEGLVRSPRGVAFIASSGPGDGRPDAIFEAALPRRLGQ